MADMVTAQELENAKIDARTIGESVNENKIVTPRYGVPFKSMPMIAEEMQSVIGTIIGGGVPASIVADASGLSQQQVNNNNESSLADRYTKSEINSALLLKANQADVDSSLALKADKSDTFTKSEVSSLVLPKADTAYVDAAVGAISTDASKQYATLALANADIANIPLNKNIFVSESDNGGYWYKATAGATSLTKSPYDPVIVAALDATAKANAAKTYANDLITESNVYVKNGGTSLKVGSTAHNSTGIPANRTIASNYELNSGLLTFVKVRIAAVGDRSLVLLLLKKNSTTSYTVAMRVYVTIPTVAVAGDIITFKAGVDFPAFALTESLVIGVYHSASSARIYYGAASSGAYYAYSGDASTVGTTQTYTGASQAISIEATTEKTPAMLNKDLIATETLSGYEATALAEFKRTKTKFGVTSLVTGDSSTAVSKVAINATALSQDGFVYEFETYIKSGLGNFELIVSEGTATEQKIINRIAVVNTSTVAGIQKFVAGKNFSAFSVKRGQRIGIYSTTVRFAYTFTGGGTYTSSDTGEPIIGSTIAVIGSNSLLQLNLTLLSLPKGRQWDGKKTVLIGDSITAIYSGTWLPELKSVTGMDVVANYGVNGQVLRTMADSLTVENMEGVELVLCLGGVNDWHHGSSTLGTASDTSTANTIYGSIKNIAEKVYATNPNALLVFATPFNTGKYTTGPEYGAANAQGLTIKNIDLAMLDACGDLGIPCFSTRQKSSVNSMNLSMVTIDNIHPSTFGGKHFGKIWGEFISQQYPWSL